MPEIGNKGNFMRANIHPQYYTVQVTCVCGNRFETRSTSKGLSKIDICSQCHPFYTGKQKILDSEGRIEKFRKKFGSHYSLKKN